jgi:hypothetical protein
MTSQPDRAANGSIDTDADEVLEPSYVAGPGGVTDAGRTDDTGFADGTGLAGGTDFADGTQPAYSGDPEDGTEPAYGTEPAAGSDRTPDPDLVVLDEGDGHDADLDRDATGDPEDDPLGRGSLSDEPDAVVAEVTAVTAEPAGDGLGSPADTVQDAGASAPGLDERWHDIQAMFVDDPRGSVQQAAAAADAAVSALVQTLQQRQAALVPAGSAAGDPGDTEQLREALRSYRIFCQNLAEIGQQLPQPAVAAR